MKTLRVEVFQNPPHERVLVDGELLAGVTFEVAFVDASSTSMTLHEFVTRVKQPSSTTKGGSVEEKVTTSTEERMDAPFAEGLEKVEQTPKPSSSG